MKKIFYLCICLLLIASCSTKKNDNAASPSPTSNAKLIRTKSETNQDVTYKSDEKVADHLTKLASSVPGVNDATAIVLGKYAVVGIDVNAKLDRSRVETIKYSVAESLKHDPLGANAVVVADIDTYQRLKDMGKRIKERKAGEGILDELAAIVGRVMPQVPNDVFEKKQINPTKENNQQLNKSEQNELKQEQVDQSNQNLKR
ncbi:YhcN/YlaJ family sporulation lipoprotein [Bacillus sp. S13(2024)]|uniref:YhcN/YlaJ family sporulation lipoprotein n=1 Tax=unclassified Bacillus (in: firmicutes) TaxID=185979 RepID=UPI003D242496